MRLQKIFLIGLLITLSIGLVNAQFRNFIIGKNNTPELKILQIDFRDYSTLVHFEYVNENKRGGICSSEDFYIQDKSTYKKYRLLNSINLPFCPNVHKYEKGQKHNFTLEFEKVSEWMRNFDIIEVGDRPSKTFSFYDLKIDYSKNTGSFIDPTAFTEETPVKEKGEYYKDGNTVFYYKHKGVVISLMLTYSNSYGKYYQTNILIQNLTGRPIDFNPNLITASFRKGGYWSDGIVYSHNSYMKKVKNKQAWSAFANAYSESMAASNAGYSSSTTSSRSNGYSTTSGSASGYVGDNYGSVYGSSSTYSSTYGTSYSKSYDGAAAYGAKQNANRNVSNYQNQQYQIKSQLSQGYARLNTIRNQTQYLGFVNIKYRKVDVSKGDDMQIIIPFNGVKFVF